MSYQAEAAELRNRINHHDRLYHELDQPEIEDAEYDAMLRRLRQLESDHPETWNPNSPTQRVGGRPTDSFSQAPHPEPMLSLGNVFTEAEFRAWHQRAAAEAAQHGANPTGASLPMTAELKIDGLALRLDYQQGALSLAATRGNGTVGEDVTHNARTIRNLPLLLPRPAAATPQHLEVRGEVYMSRTSFQAVNQERDRQGLYQYANPRNAAAGAMRQLDPKIAAKRQLRIWTYTNSSPEPGQDSHYQSLQQLADLAFPVNPITEVLHSADALVDFYRRAAAARSELDYEADGIVVKVDNLSLQRALGQTGHEPRWAVAWKFPAERAVTRLHQIKISHGRFGRLTPVAVLEPVNVGGVTVQNASLHNEEDINRKDIRPGADVLLERAGDVIPQVVGPADPEQNQLRPTFAMPDACPTCQTPVETRADEVGHWCPNEDCPSRLPEQLRSFVSKKAMDIEGLGQHWCAVLTERNIISNTAGLYHIGTSDLTRLDGMGPTRANKIVANIEGSKDRPLQNVLYALGIYRLGEEVSNLLTQRYHSLEQIRQLTEAELTEIEGIGPKIAESVVAGFQSARVQRTIQLMEQAQVKTSSDQPQNQETQTARGGNMSNPNFQDKVFVVTGKLYSMTRDQAHDLIQQQGGKTASSVTAKTNCLVIGEKPGSKLAKANSLGIPTISEQELLEMAS